MGDDLFYDRRGDDFLSAYRSKGDKYNEALQKQMMVVVTDDYIPDFKRKGYIAVWRVADIIAEDNWFSMKRRGCRHRD
jgi:hypothetical protein